MRSDMVVAVLVVVLAGSGCLGPRVLVMPSGTGVKATPKPRDCKVDFFRTKIDRAYDELAAIHVSDGDSFKNGPDDFREAVRAKACELGADAVFVTHDFSEPGGVMDATAVRYRDAGPGEQGGGTSLRLERGP